MMIRTTDTKTLKKLMIDNEIYDVNSLSLATGVNRNTLGAVLNGSIQPSAAVMEKIVLVLHIPPAKAGEIFFNENLRITQGNEADQQVVDAD